MKLVKIDGEWINPEKIVIMYETKDHRTIICFFEDFHTDFHTTWPIEKVLQAIEGSQEHNVTSNDNYEVKIAPEIPVTTGTLGYMYLVKAKNGTIFQDYRPFDYGYDRQLTWSEIPKEYRKWAKKVEN